MHVKYLHVFNLQMFFSSSEGSSALEQGKHCEQCTQPLFASSSLYPFFSFFFPFLYAKDWLNGVYLKHSTFIEQ